MFYVHLQEAWAQSHISTLRRHCSVILWSADRLFISTAKAEERYIAKETTVNSLHSNLLKKLFFAFAFDRSIDLLVEAL